MGDPRDHRPGLPRLPQDGRLCQLCRHLLHQEKGPRLQQQARRLRSPQVSGMGGMGGWEVGGTWGHLLSLKLVWECPSLRRSRLIFTRTFFRQTCMVCRKSMGTFVHYINHHMMAKKK